MSGFFLWWRESSMLWCVNLRNGLDRLTRLDEMKVSKRIAMVIGLLVLPVFGHAQTALVRGVDFEPNHWAYSSFFGTGWYQIEDARSVFVIKAPPRYTFRESSIGESGQRRFGYELRYPLTIGLHDVEDLGGIIENDNFGTMSFVPGLEMEIPLNKKWYLRPFAHIGWGRELQKGESAWIYYAGVKSRYVFPTESRFEWSLLNSLYYAGYSPDKGRSDHLAVAQAGVELSQQLKKATFLGRPLDLHFNFMYSFMGRELHFNLPDGGFDPIEDHVEFGFAASFRDGPYKLWFINVHRLGLGYRVSSSGHFTAITFSIRSWFTK